MSFELLSERAYELLASFELLCPELRLLVVVVGPSHHEERIRFASSTNLKPASVAELCRELYAAHVAS